MFFGAVWDQEVVDAIFCGFSMLFISFSRWLIPAVTSSHGCQGLKIQPRLHPEWLGATQ